VGTVWVANERRRKEKTIISRVKLVIMTKIEGASERIVRRKTIWRETENSVGLEDSSTPKVTLGKAD